jgi:hypothetical protein
MIVAGSDWRTASRSGTPVRRAYSPPPPPPPPPAQQYDSRGYAVAHSSSSSSSSNNNSSRRQQELAAARAQADATQVSKDCFNVCRKFTFLQLVARTYVLYDNSSSTMISYGSSYASHVLAAFLVYIFGIQLGNCHSAS